MVFPFQTLDSEQMKLAAIDIFSYIVEFNPSMVRDYVVHQVEGRDKEVPEDVSIVWLYNFLNHILDCNVKFCLCLVKILSVNLKITVDGVKI